MNVIIACYNDVLNSHGRQKSTAGQALLHRPIPSNRRLIAEIDVRLEGAPINKETSTAYRRRVAAISVARRVKMARSAKVLFLSLPLPIESMQRSLEDKWSNSDFVLWKTLVFIQNARNESSLVDKTNS